MTALGDTLTRCTASVVGAVKLPVNVKLKSFYASLPAFVRSLEQPVLTASWCSTVSYQSDIDLETLEQARQERSRHGGAGVSVSCGSLERDPRTQTRPRIPY